MATRKPKGAAAWVIDLRNGDGRRIRFTGFRDKRASEALERRAKEILDLRAVGAAFPLELQRWLDGLPDAMIRRLAKAGIVEAERAGSRERLDALAEKWGKSLRGGGAGAVHVRDTLHRVRKVCGAVRAIVPGDLKLDPVQDFVQAMPLSRTTQIAYTQSIKAFSEWLYERGFTRHDALARLKRLPKHDADLTVRRRVLDADDFRRFMVTVRDAGDSFYGVHASDWFKLFAFAAGSGLRWSECRALTRADVALVDGQAIIRVDGRGTKNKDDALIPVSDPSVVAILQGLIQDKLPAARVFTMPASDAGAKAMKHYCELAEIDYTDSTGARLDFHALRKAYGTMLFRAGVPLEVARQLMRHANIQTTVASYNGCDLTDKTRAAGMIRLPGMEPPEASAG